MPFQPGNKLGRGRDPVIIPEVQMAIDANRNAIKVLILSRLEGKVSDWIDQIIAAGTEEGDIIRLKMLIELALGKMVTDAPEFPVSDDEKALILEYRKRKNQVERIVGPDSSTDTK